MALLSIARDGSHLLRDGEPFIVVADTAWSAFADAHEKEWRSYVRFRASQGFNMVLVSVLPILHDRALRTDAREPFDMDESGHYLFRSPRLDYFENAREMAAVAASEGITLGLVVLWCNYVPGTWGAARTPWAVMTQPDRDAYIEMVAGTFAQYNPVFIVSGDEHFAELEPTNAYLQALETMKRGAPQCLTTLHSTPSADLPAILSDSPHLDFYCYQSGHDFNDQKLAWELAERYRAKPVRRPVIDFEPCYEGHGYGAGAGRFHREHIRRATWWSIVGGAAAGIGYGAHGVWQWYRPDAEFTNPGFSLQPFPREKALAFAGAEDVAFAAGLVVDHRLYRTASAQKLLLDPFTGLRAAATDDARTVVVYLPDARDVPLNVDLSEHAITAWDLERRSRLGVRLAHSGGLSLLEQPDTLSDVVVIATR